MAEWSKALGLGSSLLGGEGSNPSTINLFFSRMRFNYVLINSIYDSTLWE